MSLLGRMSPKNVDKLRRERIIDMEKKEIEATEVASKRKLTIDDVAKELGVSKTTVSRALSGKGRIGEETKEKVLEFVKEHNYRPNILAKGLAKSKTYNICVAFPGDYDLIDLPFFQACLMGISKVAAAVEYDILTAMVMKDDISQLKRIVSNNKVDGVILMRTLIDDMPARFLKESGIPFVVIGSSMDDEIVQIDNNHREACLGLTTLLLMKGMEKIALVGGDSNHVVTRNRYYGYRDAFEKLGKKVEENMIFTEIDNQLKADHVVQHILDKGAECIICMDDAICEYVLRKLKREHIAIPKDIKIASFYHSTLLENYTPSITSLKFNIKELGEVTCNVLLDMIRGNQVPKKTMLGYDLVLKESTKN